MSERLTRRRRGGTSGGGRGGGDGGEWFWSDRSGGDVERREVADVAFLGLAASAAAVASAVFSESLGFKGGGDRGLGGGWGDVRFGVDFGRRR